MTNKEIVHRNLGLTFDLVKYIIDNPGLLSRLPDEFILEFVDKDFSNKLDYRQKVVKKKKEIYVRVKSSFDILTRYRSKKVHAKN